MCLYEVHTAEIGFQTKRKHTHISTAEKPLDTEARGFSGQRRLDPHTATICNISVLIIPISYKLLWDFVEFAINIITILLGFVLWGIVFTNELGMWAQFKL